MAQAEMNQPGREGQWRQEGDFAPLPDDVDIDAQERQALLNLVTEAMSNEVIARDLLHGIGYPVGQLPPWATAQVYWNSVFQQFNLGVLNDPYRRLINGLRGLYPGQPLLRRLAERDSAPAQVQPPVTAPNTDVCHVIIRASDEEQRAAAEKELRRMGYEPNNIWTTQHAASYAVNSSNARDVRTAMARTNLGWTVVPPGQPDYLLRELFIQGPDGSRYRLVDAPAQQTVENVAGAVAQHYRGTNAEDTAEADQARPTVVDRIGESGARERVDARDTLHDAGIQDGDHLRVGFESRAGAVNPRDRQNALDRVLKQITEFAEGRPDMAVSANSLTLPTEYEIEFFQPSFAPPPAEGAEPAPTGDHRILIALGEDFPETAPNVFWLTPIFHPNVFPTYECERRRERPHMEGLVCLGDLADSWYPALDFGDVLQTVVDIAGYRNYDLYQPATTEEGSPTLRANFFDYEAAVWAMGHQAEIEANGGRLIRPRVPAEVGYPNVVIALD